MTNIDGSDFISISPRSSVGKCIQILEDNNITTIFVIESSKLVGTVTDGDIRRGLLKGHNIDSKVSSIMNRNYLSLPRNHTTSMASKLRTSLGSAQIPILNEDGSVFSVYSQTAAILSDITVVVMAGGRGLRLRPLTDNCPKPMLPINGTPMLEIIVRNFITLGVNQFYLSVNYLKEQIIEHFGDGTSYGVSIKYLEEDFPLGTAGSLSMIRPDTSQSILVVNGDVLSKIDYQALTRFFAESNSDALMCIRPCNMTIPFGIVNYRAHEFLSIQEKPSYDYMVNAGVYLLSPKVLAHLDYAYIDMPDYFNHLSRLGHNIHVFPIHEMWYDVGHHSTLNEVSRSQWIKDL